MDYYYIGVIGYIFAAIGFFSNKDKKTKLFLVFACLLNSIYFGMNEMMISSSIVILTGFRIFVSMHTRNLYIALFFLTSSIITPFIIQSDDWISIIPGVTGTIAAFWMQGRSMRVMLIIGSLIWIINNWISGAWIGVAGESILVFSGLFGLLRSYLKSNNGKYIQKKH